MPKRNHEAQKMSVTEWEQLPVTFDAKTMARICGSCHRYVQDHAAELGGHMVAGRWIFAKPTVASMLGL